MSLALIFPGQGSQYVGMAAALAEAYPVAAEVLDVADDVLGFALSSLMKEGPEEELRATKNAQPALLTHSVAALRVLGDVASGTAMTAGHSLGEYSAHVAAGTLSFEDALLAVRRRGELMYQAGLERDGTMAAILGLDDEAVSELCDSVQSGICVPANFNSSGQVVISGDADAVLEAMAVARERGAKRAIQLSVSGAFHSPLMEPAADGLAAHLADVSFADPRVPVVANVTAGAVTDGESAKRLLVEQLTAPVRWSASVPAMLELGAQTFLEVGSGKVLTGLNRRNAKGVPCRPMGEPADFDSE